MENKKVLQVSKKKQDQPTKQKNEKKNVQQKKNKELKGYIYLEHVTKQIGKT